MFIAERTKKYFTGSAERGVTLVEIMIAVAVLSIGIMGLIASFQYLNKGIQVSKGKSLATNLAQEKIEYLKNKSYYRIIVTSATAEDDNFNPSLVYDIYPNGEEEMFVGGIDFKRRVYIRKVAEDASGNLSYVSWNNPDTGLKEIAVYVVWQEGTEWRKLELKNLVENPDRSNLSATFSGKVTDNDSGVEIEEATVRALENTARYDVTDSDGDYSFAIEPGSYTLRVSKSGYFSVLSSQLSIESEQSLTQNFTMTKMATGTISGTAYVGTHLVISQVVGSSENAAGYDQEYVEIFNPTTYTWTVNGEIGLKFQRNADTSKKTILITYFNNSISPYGFYLFANTSTITLNGAGIGADAVWSDINSTSDFPYFASDKNIIPIDSDGSSEGSGALELYRTLSGEILDQVGWDYNPGVPKKAPFYETDGIDQTKGIEESEQYVRYASSAGPSYVYGPAYDSDNNNRNFQTVKPLTYIPSNTFSSTRTIISGTPAEGGIAFADDSVSNAGIINSDGNFTLLNVATGYWTIHISSGELFITTSSFGGTTSNFSASVGSVVLSSASTLGYVSGNVIDVVGTPLNGIAVYASGNQITTDVNGNYTLVTDPGELNVIANYQLQNAQYVEASSVNVTVEVGEITKNVDFVLSEGGSLCGWVTTNGVDALPDVPVVAFKNSLNEGDGISDENGYFEINGISTGTYSVEPQIESGESSSPGSISVTLSSAENLFVGTFTVSGVMGYISGSVTENGEPIRTGVLLYASTASISGGPPEIDSDLRSGTIVYYAASSDAEGNYNLPVRGGYTYNIYAWYTTWSGETPTITKKSYTSVVVVTGQTVTRNFNY